MVQGLFVLSYSSFLYLTLWVLHTASAFRYLPRQTVISFCRLLTGIRLKFSGAMTCPFAKGSLSGIFQWVLWQMASNRRQLRAINRFTWSTDVPQMFFYTLSFDMQTETLTKILISYHVTIYCSTVLSPLKLLLLIIIIIIIKRIIIIITVKIPII